MANIKKESHFDLSIVIVSFNTCRITIDCITSIYQSLQGCNLTCEIIVVDNASTDGSVEELEKFQKEHSSLTLLKNKDNVGFGAANNQGVKHAKAKYILLLNSDTVVINNAIEKLYTFYTTQTDYGFVGAKLLNQDETPQPSCGMFFTLPVVFATLFLRGDYWGLTRSSPDQIIQADWVSGACIMTTKKIYAELEGFDTDIFMYMEEVDLLYRGNTKGYTTGFYPESKFIHLGSASSGGKTYPILQVYRGFIFFYKKHYSRFSLFFLKIMLQLKALVSIIIGYITGSDYLKKTYGEAYSIAKMA